MLLLSPNENLRWWYSHRSRKLKRRSLRQRVCISWVIRAVQVRNLLFLFHVSPKLALWQQLLIIICKKRSKLSRKISWEIISHHRTSLFFRIRRSIISRWICRVGGIDHQPEIKGFQKEEDYKFLQWRLIRVVLLNKFRWKLRIFRQIATIILLNKSIMERFWSNYVGIKTLILWLRRLICT